VEFRAQLLHDLGQSLIDLLLLFWRSDLCAFLIRLAFLLPYRAVPTPSCPGAIDASFFKFTQRRSSYLPPNSACGLSLCGLSFVPALPVAVVLGCSVWHELFAAELAFLQGSECRLLVLEVVRIPALVRAKVMVAVERLEPLAANSTSG